MFKKDVNYFKAINESKKYFTNAKKQLKYNIVDDAAMHLRTACHALDNYAASFNVPTHGGGQHPDGPAFRSAVEAATNATEAAMAELDFNNVDIGYKNGLQALNCILPYCK